MRQGRVLAVASAYFFDGGRAKPVLTYVLWLGLPGLCVAAGLVVFLRRRT